MFEAAEIDHRVDRADHEKQVPALRERLLEAQYALLESKKASLLVLIGGIEGAGKGETVNTLNEWLDPRHVRTHGFADPVGDEVFHPDLWRYWRALPPRGHVGMFVGSWYTIPIVKHAHGDIKDADLDQHLGHVRRFEQMLVQERVVLLKFWFHLSRKDQAERLATLRKDQRTSWRVTKRDLKDFKLYEEFQTAATRALRQTSTAAAPWIIVPGKDERYRQLTVGKAVLQALESIEQGRAPAPAPATPASAASSGAVDGRTVLGAMDLTASLSGKTYEQKLERHQGRLNRLVRHKKFSKRSLVLVFEGWDAAGKGGAIRRVTRALDARMCRVVQVAAPTEEERAQPYLWRFWRNTPRPGRVVIFDRSWYGRVLVERVEGFASDADWARAYTEINEFEEQLVDNGTIVLKFWLHLSPEEQLARFKAREKTGYKRHKLTPDDWRNRDKWGPYEQAVEEMVARTSTEIAPWTLVAATDKRHARIHVLDTVCDQVERQLKRAMGKRSRG